jgi:hypothetical protein
MKGLRFPTLTLVAITVFMTLWSPLPARAAGLNFDKNCTSKMRGLVTDAYARTIPALKKGIAKIDSDPSAAVVVTWFGKSNNQQHITTVRANLQTMLDRLNSRTPFTIECGSRDCDDGDYAHATSGIDYLATCEAYFGQPLTGFDSRPGILLHELSHHTVDTDDITYGTASAMKLAKSNVPSAIKNADNYEYYLETFL